MRSRIMTSGASLAMMAAHGMALREMLKPIEREQPPVAQWREEEERKAAENEARRERETAFGKAAISAAEAKRARKAAKRRAALSSEGK